MAVSLSLHYILPDITYHGVIIYKDCQRGLPTMYSRLALGSRCDIADVFKSRQKFWGRLSSMLKINVVLPNGHAELLALLPSATVQDLRTEAQQAFGKKYLRLITAKNRVLVSSEKTLEEAEIEDGECLTALALQPQLAATRDAFALWCHGDSAVVTSGEEYNGGDSSAVQDQLRGEADSIHRKGLCCDSGRWIRRDLRWRILWRWQFGSSGSAQELRGVYCRFKPLEQTKERTKGRTNEGTNERRDERREGRTKGGTKEGRDERSTCSVYLWRWQFGSSRSSQGCAADSSRRYCFCCDSGRWNYDHCGSDSSALLSSCWVFVWKMLGGLCLEENKCRCCFHWKTSSLRRFAVVLFLMKSSEPRLNFGRFTRHTKKCSISETCCQWVISNGCL